MIASRAQASSPHEPTIRTIDTTNIFTTYTHSAGLTSMGFSSLAIAVCHVDLLPPSFSASDGHS